MSFKSFSTGQTVPAKPVAAAQPKVAPVPGQPVPPTVKPAGVVKP